MSYKIRYDKLNCSVLQWGDASPKVVYGIFSFTGLTSINKLWDVVEGDGGSVWGRGGGGGGCQKVSENATIWFLFLTSSLILPILLIANLQFKTLTNESV